MGENGGYAFPHPGSINEHGNRDVYPELGMFLRDYFAGQAMVGMFASLKEHESPGNPTLVAKSAYIFADAMLKEREK